MPMKLTVPMTARATPSPQLIRHNIIKTRTRFGWAAASRDRRQHDLMDADWTVSPVT